MTKLDYLFKQYENVLYWQQHAQQLSRFVLAINTAIVGIFNGLYFAGNGKLAEKITIDNPLAIALLALCSLALIASFLFFFRSIWAKHNKGPEQLDTNEKLWFFGHVASMSKDSFFEALKEWSEEDAISSLQSQIHIVSGNLRSRFTNVNISFTCTGIALVSLFFIGIA